MHIKKVKYSGFLSVGEEPVEVDFDSYSGIVLVKGRNLDISEHASNGAGKSSLWGAILFALYGKIPRGLSGDDVVNSAMQRHCRVELDVDDLHIIRCRKKNALQIYDNGEDVTQPTMSKTQEWLNDYLGVDYNTATNLLCFGQHNTFSFVDADRKQKEAIVEQLLSLEEHNAYLKECLDFQSKTKSKLRVLFEAHSRLTSERDRHASDIARYMELEKQHKTKIETDIAELERQLAGYAGLDVGALLHEWDRYDRAKRIEARLKTKINEEGKKLAMLSVEINHCRSELNKAKKHLHEVETLVPGTKCRSCFANITSDTKSAAITTIGDEVKKLEGILTQYIKLHNALNARLQTLSKRSEFLAKIQSPTVSRDELGRIETTIASMSSALNDKKSQLSESPYQKILADLKEKLDKAESEIKSLDFDIRSRERIVRYLDFWEYGFGPNGVRGLIIEQMLPVLNARINYWLQFLIGNKLSITFDKRLDVEILRDSGSMLYKQASGGERKKIDLAIALSFAYVMRLSAGVDHNLIFLDEVAENIDGDGVVGIFEMLQELAFERTVFVITHNQTLLDLLEGQADTIQFVKSGGFTTVMDRKQ